MEDVIKSSQLCYSKKVNIQTEQDVPEQTWYPWLAVSIQLLQTGPTLLSLIFGMKLFFQCMGGKHYRYFADQLYASTQGLIQLLCPLRNAVYFFK